jgi:preprotein translocase subunit SecG
MTTLLIAVHIVVCLFLIVIVLLQHGKGASMGASFGGSSQTVFGTEGPLPLLNKITTGAAILFMATSLALAFVSSRKGDGSVMKDLAVPAAVQEQRESAPPATAIPLPGEESAGGDIPMAPARQQQQ